MNPQVIRIQITFLDGSTATWDSNSTETKHAIADFLSKKYLYIDGEHYNTNHVFSWKVVDAKK